MKYKQYKCFFVAAAIIMGITLTACGAEGTENQSTDSVTVSVSEDIEKTTESSEEVVNDKETTESIADKNVESTSEDEQIAEETGEQNDDAETMYTIESITLHKEASGASEDLGVVPVGSTVQAYEVSGDYIRVLFEGNEGYVLKEYVTQDKDAADNALKKSIEESKQVDTKSGDGQSSNKKKKSTECLENGLLN